MEELRKAKFHSVDITKLIKNQSCKKDHGEKLIQTQVAKWLMRF